MLHIEKMYKQQSDQYLKCKKQKNYMLAIKKSLVRLAPTDNFLDLGKLNLLMLV